MIETAARSLLKLDLWIYIPIIILFWFPDQRRIAALLLFLPLAAARWVLYRRLWKSTPLDPLFIAFLILGCLNVFFAPYYFIAPDLAGLVMLGRPAMGMLLATSLADNAWRSQRMTAVLVATVTLSLIVGVLALVSSQWTVKSSQLLFIIDLLPKVRGVPQIGFNVNEIAGAMTYLTPLMAGLAAYFWSQPAAARGDKWLRALTSLAFCLLWLATFLGQSRLAIIGVLPALYVISLTLVRPGRWRLAAVAGVTFFLLAQVAILSGIFNPQAERLAERDEDSLSTRVLIWESGLQILIDHPLTGAGMNAFRAPAVRALYPVPGYETRVLPHAHNEWIQIAADLGLPGLLVFASWFIVIGWMLRKVWQQGDARARAVALSVGCGLAAHLVYGLGDAIPLWDRFAFVFWWLVGVAAAQYLLTCQRPQSLRNSKFV